MFLPFALGGLKVIPAQNCKAQICSQVLSLGVWKKTNDSQENLKNKDDEDQVIVFFNKKKLAQLRIKILFSSYKMF